MSEQKDNAPKEQNTVPEIKKKVKIQPPSSTFTSPDSLNISPNNLRQFKRGNNQMAFIHQIKKNPIENEELRKKLNNRYTMEEVAKHNKPDDCWMVFNNVVYDVTEYLNFHPGGRSILMTCAGKDGTSMFYKCHPWVDYNVLLKNYTIGTITK
ncbi:cytochrome b5 [Anaeromyces robustus]|uniref:Cytochrome b5 n=1 Tax=Anaeromyces robustus TaxID=1754192 RepID=A0A1Y1XML9_9FUNG|nr:cytochrome b5 [Anaeromyces robustus]|eukprot:ORX86987.1 cytochrome b5 [Anaeromyces robustus]